MSFKNVKCIAKVIAQKTMLCGDENKLKLFDVTNSPMIKKIFF